MRTASVLLSASAIMALFAWACDETGLGRDPRADFTQIACLDVNGDDVVNAADASDIDEIPDINGDGDEDEQDASFVTGVEIPLDPNRDPELCQEGGSDRTPEFAVPHGYFSDADITCEGDARPVLIVGVGGGIVNLREREDAAGIRTVIDKLQDAYADRDVSTQPVLAGPLVHAATNQHTAMEDWLTNATRLFLERHSCLRLVMIGHSHGAVTVDVVSARLEDQFGDRFIAVVDVDRVDSLYDGDTQSRPHVIPAFNVFETNDEPHGTPYESPNAENWDATGEVGPAEGEEGGAPEPVIHTTIDNSDAVHQRIVQEVIERS